MTMKHKIDNFFREEMMGSADVFPIISLDEQQSEKSLNDGEVLPILALRNMVIYPGVLLPVAVARPNR
jgi:ATP-dependent Lon protease